MEGQQGAFLNMLVGRRLDSMTTGNGSYLMVFLRSVRDADLKVRLVFAPRRSFENRPWFQLHPEFTAIASEVVVPGSVRVGNAYWSLSPTVWGRFVLRLGKEALRRIGLGNVPLAHVGSLLGAPLSDGEAAELARASDAHAAAIVVAEYSSLGGVLPKIKTASKKAVLLHDLFSLRAASFRSRGEAPDHYEMTEAEEAKLVSAADILVFASANEMVRFRSHTPKASHVWLRPEVPEYPEANDNEPPRAVFLGTRHAGNTDALRHLIDDVWPLVRQRSPSANLWVAGSACEDLSAAQRSTPGVRVMGRVHQLGSIGGASSIGLAPTRVASGVSIKVAEYLRLGMPCVAYPVALEGFGQELDDLVDIADGPNAMADCIVALFSDRNARRQRSDTGRKAAAQRLHNQQVIDILRAAAAAR